ncbi:MAG: alpha/beta hydrolase-fold protein, partial [Capsulimonadales bacterium]|nr:alpha/beta hydrolase-fold protein [Capsulimonadales bacterium]
GRAIAGLSMGGYGAWRIALDLPDTFCAAAALSGALFWGEGPTDNIGLNGIFQEVYGKVPTAEEYRREGLRPRIDKLGSGTSWRGPALYFDCGADDFLLSTNRMMEQHLMTRRIPYEFAEFTGRHDWPYWSEHIADVFQFVERHLAAPE